MKTPYKHAELIKAWADGATIQLNIDGVWVTDPHPQWSVDRQYRIKSKPDVVKYGCLDKDYTNRVTIRSNYFSDYAHCCDNLMVVYDGETGQLKDCQILAKE